MENVGIGLVILSIETLFAVKRKLTFPQNQWNVSEMQCGIPSSEYKALYCADAYSCPLFQTSLPILGSLISEPSSVLVAASSIPDSLFVSDGDRSFLH